MFYLSGVEKLVGLDGCIKRFKLGHREVKIQSASEPLALRRISLNECQSGGGSLEEAIPSSSASSFKRDLCRDFSCQNGGVCLSFGATAKCQCKKYVKRETFFWRRRHSTFKVLLWKRIFSVRMCIFSSKWSSCSIMTTFDSVANFRYYLYGKIWKFWKTKLKLDSLNEFVLASTENCLMVSRNTLMRSDQSV